MTKVMKRVGALLFAMVIVLTVFAGCNASSKDAENTIEVDGKKVAVPYALKFDDYEVSMDEYKYYYLNMKAEAEATDAAIWETSPEAEDGLKQQVETALREQYAQVALADKNGVTLTEEDLAKAKENFEAVKSENFESEEDFQSQLKSYNLTEKLFTDVILNRQEIMTKLQAKYDSELFGEGGEFALTPEKEDAFINENYVHVVHVLVDEETTANEVIAKINGGTPIADLLEEYNTDTGETAEGYTFTRGQMVKEFEDAAYALKDGEVSAPVATTYGYHVIQRFPLDPTYIAEHKDELLDGYKQTKLNEKMTADAETIRDNFTVTYGDQYDKFSTKTILPAEGAAVGEPTTGNLPLNVAHIILLVLSIILGTLIGVLFIIALFMIFIKAGEPGWAAFVPFFNTYTAFKITWGNGWMFLTLLIPVVNLVIGIITLHKLSKVFGHGADWFFGLLFLPCIFLPMLAFGKSRYVGVEATKKPNGEDAFKNDNNSGVFGVNDYENKLDNAATATETVAKSEAEETTEKATEVKEDAAEVKDETAEKTEEVEDAPAETVDKVKEEIEKAVDEIKE